MMVKPTVLTLLGTRPEIVKLSPLIPELRTRFEHILVHSNQHYSAALDAVFFDELQLPEPDYSLGVGSAGHGEQTARMLSRLEPILQQRRPDLVLVQGDTNTTLAGALAAAKLGIAVAHLEAGCRSFNRSMPEELNRVVVDHLSALLLAPDELARTQLAREGISEQAIQVVGSSAIDACLRCATLAAASPILEQFELEPGTYLVLTLHRAENTTAEKLPGLLRVLGELACAQLIIFPLHPRTAAAVAQQGLQLPPELRLTEPLPYLAMLRLLGAARALLTDSGGLQEEAAVLGTPALILREETEWRAFVEAGIHRLVGNNPDSLLPVLRAALEPANLATMRTAAAPIWPGASSRAIAAISAFLE